MRRRITSPLLEPMGRTAPLIESRYCLHLQRIFLTILHARVLWQHQPGAGRAADLPTLNDVCSTCAPMDPNAPDTYFLIPILA